MTFTSAELIDALRRRMRRSLRPETPPGEFPPAWSAWFAAMRERLGKIKGATADAIVAIFLAREPALPPRAVRSLNRWQSFNTLWRQQWHPASRDERSTRIVASVITLLVHIFLAAFLLYLAYVRFMGIPEDAAREGDEDVIQVEYIGEGTPQEQGGGPAQGEQAQPTPAAASPATKPQPAPVAEVVPPPPSPTAPETSTQPAPQNQAPAIPAPQPLQVTETPTPDQTFTLPPPRTADVPQPLLPTPEFAAPAPEIRMVDVPAPIQPIEPMKLPDSAIAAPQLQRRNAEVVVREVAAPLAAVPLRQVAQKPLDVPQLQARAPGIAARDIPAPPGPPAVAQANDTARSPATGVAATPTSTPAGGTNTANNGANPARPSSGAGPSVAPKPGALPAPKRGDDWGASDRNRPGGQSGKPGGLFNANGTPRLASVDEKVGGGLPPGTITEDFAKIDRNGTWLKRPSMDYTPTAFDQFWVPNETLLQEWVRKSIKEVLIPIPGTSKKIKCTVILLMAGGGCGISDANMQDVEATARKPPDVPFKPELQEDQDSLAKPAAAKP
jgi:hypothetical protein